MNIFKIALTIIILFLMTSGCASSRSGQVYSRDHARKAHTIKLGTVEAVKQVSIEGTKSGVGAVAGGAIGGAVGSTIGSGSGKTVATVLGAVVGGVAGAATEDEVTKKDGLEITVELDNGDVIAVVQEADEPFIVGDRVRVLTGPDGTTRVRH
ncbi:glycine zipper 2TM domain-containing protein [Thermodesulfobacteriota bacterium]